MQAEPSAEVSLKKKSRRSKKKKMIEKRGKSEAKGGLIVDRGRAAYTQVKIENGVDYQ